MRRAPIVAFALLLAVALVAPTAQAKTQTRYLEGKIDGGGRVQLAVQYRVTKGKKGQKVRKKWVIQNGRKLFTPKWLTYSATKNVPVSCDQGEARANHSTGFRVPRGDPGAIIIRFRGLFSYALGVVDREGKFGGGMWRKGKRARASGTMKWIYTRVTASSGETYTRCTTNGPKRWTAHQCLRKGKPRKGLPRCRADSFGEPPSGVSSGSAGVEPTGADAGVEPTGGDAGVEPAHPLVAVAMPLLGACDAGPPGRGLFELVEPLVVAWRSAANPDRPLTPERQEVLCAVAESPG